MPRDTSIGSVLVVGSGPIVIGQAAEFDYAGTQAVKVLRREGVRVIRGNSNGLISAARTRRLLRGLQQLPAAQSRGPARTRAASGYTPRALAGCLRPPPGRPSVL